ncbi:MAG: outer membrane protein assembly factor BamE [Magnetococcales bacterium]|nr:outer membrane protein assembly factor BamE [Magnetococcales bacterium]NGZ28495.1 outer membrane protein assembly factor BamE [Magnetococcales bacterium]
MTLRHFRWLIILALLSGCETPIQERGNILDPKEVDRIRVGRSTQKEVKELLGSPTLVNMYNKNRWLYVHDRRHKGTRAVNRLEITFDYNGVVQNVQRNFQDGVMDPTALPDDKKPSWWQAALRMGPEIGVPERGKDIPKRLAGHAGEKQKSLWERLFDFSKPQTEPPPSLVYKKDEAGWWRTMFTQDPGHASYSHMDDEEVSKLVGDSFHTSDKPAPPPATKGSDKPWWRFWSWE